MNCSECQDLIASYALDALTGDERERVRAHLATGCAQCTAEWKAMQATVGQLPLLLDSVAPPAGAKSRLMERVRAGRGTDDSRMHPTGPSMRTRSRSRRWAEPLVAAAAAAAIATAVFWVKIDRQQTQIASLSDAVSRQEARVDQLQASLEREGDTIRLFASPGVQLVSLQGSGDQAGAKARVFLDKDRKAFHLYASGLKPLAGSKVYELWFINADQKKIPAGTFTVNPRGEASLVATPPPEAGRIAALAVTDEPAGGSRQPTGHIQLVGQAG
jgi:anti-sigma-K factor RskA